MAEEFDNKTENTSAQSNGGGREGYRSNDYQGGGYRSNGGRTMRPRIGGASAPTAQIVAMTTTMTAASVRKVSAQVCSTTTTAAATSSVAVRAAIVLATTRRRQRRLSAAWRSGRLSSSLQPGRRQRRLPAAWRYQQRGGQGGYGNRQGGYQQRGGQGGYGNRQVAISSVAVRAVMATVRVAIVLAQPTTIQMQSTVSRRE